MSKTTQFSTVRDKIPTEIDIKSTHTSCRAVMASPSQRLACCSLSIAFCSHVAAAASPFSALDLREMERGVSLVSRLLLLLLLCC